MAFKLPAFEVVGDVLPYSAVWDESIIEFRRPRRRVLQSPSTACEGIAARVSLWWQLSEATSLFAKLLDRRASFHCRYNAPRFQTLITD